MGILSLEYLVCSISGCQIDDSVFRNGLGFTYKIEVSIGGNVFNKMLHNSNSTIFSLYQLERQICTIEAAFDKAVVQLILGIIHIY